MGVARLGFEPRLSESESLVLPLHYQARVGNGSLLAQTNMKYDIVR